MKIINSEQDLAWTLGIPLVRLRRIASTPALNYREFSQWKDASKSQARRIRNPRDELKNMQRLLKTRIFEGYGFGPEVQGGIAGCSPKSNAEQHLNAQILVTVDVKRFFDSVDHRVVFKTLREFGYGTRVASLLTKLVTRSGLLPQGAPTSGLIANLVVARSVDTPTKIEASNESIRFTRFVDDIALSGEDPTVQIGRIARRLSSRGLSIHRGRKLKVMPRSKPQMVTGLNINSGRSTVPRQYRDNVRAAIHGLAAIADRAQRDEAARSISGRIAYVRQFQPAAAQRLAEQLSNATR